MRLWLGSLLVHALLLALLRWGLPHAVPRARAPLPLMAVELRAAGPRAGAAAQPGGAATEKPARRDRAVRTGRAQGFRYLPEWAGRIESAPAQDPAAGPGVSDASLGMSRELLGTESKVWAVFDLLAGRINRHLDYPELLAENGVQGGAVLDLYFDSRGAVDEGRSHTSGDNRLVRGLLVRAARRGLVEWLSNDASRLRREQFKSQHFRADFVLAYSQTDRAELRQVAPGSYGFMRRHVSNIACIGEIGGAPVLNLACLAIAAGGAIHRSVSAKYRGQVSALKDELERFDELGLDGVNRLAGGAG